MIIEKTKKELLSSQMILIKIISPMAICLMTLFSFYIQFNGAESPGGAFQSGIILAVTMIFHDLLTSITMKLKNHKTIPNKMALSLSILGVLIYAAAGTIPIFSGHNIFDYTALASNHHDANHYGILAIETGVALTVFGSIMLMFNSFKEQVNF